MSEMKINNLSVDLLQDNATISLFRQDVFQNGKNTITSVNVSVPIGAPGEHPENQLKRHAISAAKKSLEEAIRALDDYTT